MDVVQELYCETCAAVTPFEACSSATPHVDDDHDGDRPEWACTRCGEAIVLGPLTVLAAA